MIDIYSKSYLNELYNSIFEGSTTGIYNKKGISYDERFRDILSDPNNLFIKRDDNSGKLNSGVINLHHGVKVYDNCYYDSFSEILKLNLGVHEPAEERAFQYVIECLSQYNKEMFMVELGSYWAFYSIWFKKAITNSKVFCIEPESDCLESGIRNFELNQIDGDFTQAFIGDGLGQLNLSHFLKQKNIDYLDILHSDIQGNELVMLKQIQAELKNKKINYIFLSTHSNPLHYQCIDFLTSNNYRIICSSDFENETYQFDGFILSCPDDNLEIPSFNIGNRSSAELISIEKFNQIKKTRSSDNL